jgi:phosphonate transport system substrate-binding protein
MSVAAKKRITGGFDGNLDFPFDDPQWAPLAREMNFAATSYVDLDTLVDGVREKLFDLSYLPSSSCYFLRRAPYTGLVSALTAITRKPQQSSLFIVAKSNPVADWKDLRGKRYGYINTYCTTSYFAPSILLSPTGQSLTQFFNAFSVPPWQGQIDAVLAGEIDATSVYEDVWMKKPENAQQTKVLARIDDLPTPPIIASNALDAELQAKIKATLLAMQPAAGADALYSGFTEYNDPLMQKWFADLAALPAARAA